MVQLGHEQIAGHAEQVADQVHRQRLTAHLGRLVDHGHAELSYTSGGDIVTQVPPNGLAESVRYGSESDRIARQSELVGGFLPKPQMS